MFSDRLEGGKALAALLAPYSARAEAIVLALPRGGVPVGFEVARRLGLPLDVLIVRKLGMPGNPEMAMGAIASGGVRYLNEEVIRMAGLARGDVERVETAEKVELERRERLYRGKRKPLQIEGRTVILVDDGIATGASMRAAARAMRAGKATWIVVAVPVASADAAARFRGMCDEFVCAYAPKSFYAVGQFYHRFDQVTDDEVRELLESANRVEA